MFCPVCRDEFREGFSRCPDCDVSLVVRLEEPEPETSEETVVVFETEDHSLGGVIKGLLESSGIPVATENLSAFAWSGPTKGINLAGPIRIRVPRGQEADACALIAAPPPSAEPEPPDDAS